MKENTQAETSLTGKKLIKQIDHVVITTENETECIHFYTNTLGMKLEIFGEGRRAFCFGNQKINLHVKGKEFEPKAAKPTPGALDICFITDRPIEQVVDDLSASGVRIVEGPVQRTGANGPIVSVYIRDPDQNLIEISEYLTE